MKDNKHSKSTTLTTKGFGGLAKDYGELAIDSVLNDGVLKDIPILGTLINLYKSGANVKEYLFSRKVENFIDNLESFSQEEVEKFNNTIEHDPKLKARVSEHLTLLLDRLDDMEKSRFISMVFSAFLKQEIDFAQFRRLARAIERCMIDDLREVHNFERANDAHSEITYDLAANGLIELVGLPSVPAPEAKPMYKITDFGELFVKIVRF